MWLVLPLGENRAGYLPPTVEVLRTVCKPEKRKRKRKMVRRCILLSSRWKFIQISRAYLKNMYITKNSKAVIGKIKNLHRKILKRIFNK